MSMRSNALALALLAGSTFSTLAGEQYVDSSGYAVSGFDVVAFFDQEQSPIGTPQKAATRGKSAYTAEYNGAKWAFSTVANRDKFVADPEKYAPQFDGHCAYGVAKGGKVPANPNLWRIVDDKLFLNITKNVVTFWEEDVPSNISIATVNWNNLETKGSADSEIPQYDGPIGPADQ
ncbi:MAG: YHS domain-containing (seleno)protein [Rhizobiaceae bacterium]|nr:YHS domain-containing (seleno)protein [Rhizobiaceae bacterium]